MRRLGPSLHHLPREEKRLAPSLRQAILAQVRFRPKREQLTTFSGLLPPSQGQNLTLTVLYVPYSLNRSYLFPSSFEIVNTGASERKS